MQTATKTKLILIYIRLRGTAFERITWAQTPDGRKISCHEPATPTPDQLNRISKSPYFECYEQPATLTA